MSENENARLYEIVDKVSGEVFPVSHDGSGDLDNDQDADFFCKKEDGTEVVFAREGSTEEGNAIFTNEQYVIRDRETKLALDGVTPVPDVVPATPAVVEDTTNEDGSVNHIVTEQDHAEGKFTEALVGAEVTYKPEAPAPVVENNEVAVDTTPAEPRKFFEGKVVISDGTREVNGITYHAIRLEDGSMYDLTAEDYKVKVTLETL